MTHRSSKKKLTRFFYTMFLSKDKV